LAAFPMEVLAMLTLYSAKGACSLAPHIILEAAGLNYRVVHVDLRAKAIEDGSDYWAINPKGAVPALGLDAAAGAEGEVLTENAVVLQYLADRVPGSGLLPASGLDRYRTLEWVNYIATELHKGFGPLFDPATLDDAKTLQIKLIEKKLDFIANALNGRDFLTGSDFRICDAYLFTILRWTDLVKIDIARWPDLAAFRQRIALLHSVAEVLQREGLKA
jgi:glutathione S-transferase